MRAPLDSNGRPGAWTTVALAPERRASRTSSGASPSTTRPVRRLRRHLRLVGQLRGRARSTGCRAPTAPSPVTERAASAGPARPRSCASSTGTSTPSANDSGGAGVGAFRLADARNGHPGHAVAPHRRRALGHQREVLRPRDLHGGASTTTLWVTSDKAWRPSTDHRLQVHVAGNVDRRLRHRRFVGRAAPRPRRHAQRHRRAQQPAPAVLAHHQRRVRLAGHRPRLHRQRHQREPGRSQHADHGRPGRPLADGRTTARPGTRCRPGSTSWSSPGSRPTRPSRPPWPSGRSTSGASPVTTGS